MNQKFVNYLQLLESRAPASQKADFHNAIELYKAKAARMESNGNPFERTPEMVTSPGKVDAWVDCRLKPLISRAKKADGLGGSEGSKAKYESEYNLTETLAGENTEPDQHITRTQTLRWHDARKDIPEMLRVCIIKVPGRPWRFGGKGDIKQAVVYLSPRKPFHDGEPPFVVSGHGGGTYDYDEVTEWAYLDE